MTFIHKAKKNNCRTFGSTAGERLTFCETKEYKPLADKNWIHVSCPKCREGCTNEEVKDYWSTKTRP